MRKWFAMLSDVLVVGFVAWYVRIRWGADAAGKPLP
jgi:hypothetical protein